MLNVRAGQKQLQSSQPGLFDNPFPPSRIVRPLGTQKPLITEIIFEMPPHIKTASQRLEHMMLRLLGGQQSEASSKITYLDGAKETQDAIAQVGMPHEISAITLSNLHTAVEKRVKNPAKALPMALLHPMQAYRLRLFATSHLPEKEITMSVNGTEYLLKLEGGKVLSECNLKGVALRNISLAKHLAHTIDLLNSGSVKAAARYVDGHGASLKNDEYRFLQLKNIFAGLHEGGENPKMLDLEARLRAAPDEKCLVFCYNEEQKRVLEEKMAPICPGIVVSNHPSKTDLAGFSTIILFNPERQSITRALETSGRNIIAYIDKAVGARRYWKFSTIEKAKHKPHEGFQTSFPVTGAENTFKD